MRVKFNITLIDYRRLKDVVGKRSFLFMYLTYISQLLQITYFLIAIIPE